MTSEAVLDRALLLADEFLGSARGQIVKLADDDLDQLRAAATALRSAAADRSTPDKGREHIAYVVVAAAFNQVLAARDRR